MTDLYTKMTDTMLILISFFIVSRVILIIRKRVFSLGWPFEFVAYVQKILFFNRLGNFENFLLALRYIKREIKEKFSREKVIN